MNEIHILLVALQYVKYWSITLLCAWREVSFKWQPKERWCFESKSWRPLFFEIYAKIVLFLRGVHTEIACCLQGLDFPQRPPHCPEKVHYHFIFCIFKRAGLCCRFLEVRIFKFGKPKAKHTLQDKQILRKIFYLFFWNRMLQ